MPKFDHRFDNAVTKKEDVRFTEQEEAEDYAVAQYNMYFQPQAVLVEKDTGMLYVKEFMLGYCPSEATFIIYQSFGEG